MMTAQERASITLNQFIDATNTNLDAYPELKRQLESVIASSITTAEQAAEAEMCERAAKVCDVRADEMEEDEWKQKNEAKNCASAIRALSPQGTK